MKYTTLIFEAADYSKKALADYASLGDVYLLDDLIPHFSAGLTMSQILNKISGHRKSKMLEILNRADIIVLRLAYKIDASWMDKMPNLKVIATPTTGLNHVDVVEAKKRGIKIICLKGRSGFLKYVPATAEETMGLIFASVRKLPWAFEHVKKGGWDRNLFRGNQLLGKTIGLLGFGRLGKLVAKYSRVFGMSVIAYDPHVSKNVFMRYGVQRVSMDALFKTADILSVHAYLTDETKDMTQERHFRMMKPTAHFINTARGEIVDEKALLQALKEKWIAGAALDVLWDEVGDGSHLKGNPLLAYARANQNLIIVPHIGGAAHEAMHVTEEFISHLVKKYCK